MNDMAQVTVPRSDQINADSLLAGPITVTITSVDIKAGSEQPITIHYEGEDGKPWRPCKSMARCLVAAWGPDSKAYTGRSLTLYCDPKVKWGGLEVGGIRVSHMSHIDAAMTMALTVTRGSKKPYTVKPLVADAKPDYSASLKSARTIDELGAAWSKIPKSEQKQYAAVKDARKAELSQPVTISDRIKSCANNEELDALAESLTGDDVGIYFDAIAKRKNELLDAAAGGQV